MNLTPYEAFEALLNDAFLHRGLLFTKDWKDCTDPFDIIPQRNFIHSNNAEGRKITGSIEVYHQEAILALNWKVDAPLDSFEPDEGNVSIAALMEKGKRRIVLSQENWMTPRLKHGLLVSYDGETGTALTVQFQETTGVQGTNPHYQSQRRSFEFSQWLQETKRENLQLDVNDRHYDFIYDPSGHYDEQDKNIPITTLDFSAYQKKQRWIWSAEIRELLGSASFTFPQKMDLDGLQFAIGHAFRSAMARWEPRISTVHRKIPYS